MHQAAHQPGFGAKPLARMADAVVLERLPPDLRVLPFGGGQLGIDGFAPGIALDARVKRALYGPVRKEGGGLWWSGRGRIRAPCTLWPSLLSVP